MNTLLTFLSISLALFSVPSIAASPQQELENLVSSVLVTPEERPAKLEIDARGLPILSDRARLWHGAAQRALDLGQILEKSSPELLLDLYAKSYAKITARIDANAQLAKDHSNSDPSPSLAQIAKHGVLTLDGDPERIKDPALRKQYEKGIEYRAKTAEFAAWQGGLKRLQTHLLYAFGAVASNEYSHHRDGEERLRKRLLAGGLENRAVQRLMADAKERTKLFASRSN